MTLIWRLWVASYSFTVSISIYDQTTLMLENILSAASCAKILMKRKYQGMQFLAWVKSDGRKDGWKNFINLMNGNHNFKSFWGQQGCNVSPMSIHFSRLAMRYKVAGELRTDGMILRHRGTMVKYDLRSNENREVSLLDLRGSVSS